MTDSSSLGSSEEPLPVYFRPFTRESLEAIKQRMVEEEIKKKELEAKKAETEVNVNEPFT
jgi:hypothetical protein